MSGCKNSSKKPWGAPRPYFHRESHHLRAVAEVRRSPGVAKDLLPVYQQNGNEECAQTLTQSSVSKPLLQQGSPASPAGLPTAGSHWPTYVWWAPKGKGRKRAGYPGHPPLCVEIISVFRAPKTYASAKTLSSEHQKSLGESSGTSEKMILARLWVWKCGLLPSVKGEWKLLFWEKPLGIRRAPWVRYRNKANCRCHSHRAVFALG